MADFIVEVDEAMKQERLEKLWQSYGGFFLGLIAMLILGTAANAGYSHWKSQKNIAQTDVYLDALIDENETSEALAVAKNKIENPNLKALAQIHAAGRALDENKDGQAVKLYQIENTSSEILNGLSDLMSVTQNDTLSASEKVERLNQISSNPNNPWRYHALMETALLNAHDLGNIQNARQNLKQIIDAENIPQTLKKKAQSLDILYALKGNKK